MTPFKPVDSAFSHLENVPMDEAFVIMRDFASDSSLAKVDLGAGVYRDENEGPFVLPSVQKVSYVLQFSLTSYHADTQLLPPTPAN
jgi:aspartate/tyrosine/aromatic aminotransferase